MPKAETLRLPRQRPTPYQSRSISTTGPPTSRMATAAMLSPVPPHLAWHPVQHQHQHQHPQEQQWQQQHLSGFAAPNMLHQQDYPQALQAPGLPVAPPQQQQQQQSASRATSSSAIFGSGPWTPEMDEILLENARRLKWDQIAEVYFNTQKSGNACRKRYARLLMERREPTRWEAARVQRVVSAYNNEGLRQRIWAPLADAVGEHWQDVERLCYTQGLRAMTARGGSGHARRRSNAPSHHSYASDYDPAGNDGGDPKDDSGLGDDLQEMSRHAHSAVQQGGPVSAAGPYLDRLHYSDAGYTYSSLS